MKLIQSLYRLPLAAPTINASFVPVPFPGHIDQAVMFLVPVIGPVPFQHPRLMELQVCKQIRLPRRLNLLFGYAGHDTGTVFLFIVLCLLSVMKKTPGGA